MDIPPCMLNISHTSTTRNELKIHNTVTHTKTLMLQQVITANTPTQLQLQPDLPC